MKLACFITILLFLFITIHAIGQTDFRPGYYISWGNDTIYGLVDYRGNIRNSKFCVFKKNESSESQRFIPKEIKAYRFSESKYYISKKLKTANKQVFVEFLVNGITNLYYYSDTQNSMYLLEDKNGNLLELTNEYITGYVEGVGEVKRESNRYIGLLKATFADCQEVLSLVNGARLEHKSLIDITTKYHDYVCDDEKCILYTKKPDIFKVDLSIYSGFSMSNLDINGGGLLSDNYNTAYFPEIGIGVNFIFPRINEKISLELNADVSKKSFFSIFETQTYSRTIVHLLEVDFIPIEVDAGLKYTYPKGKIRPFVLGGICITSLIDINTSRRSEENDNSVIRTTIKENISIGNVFFGPIINLGFNFVKRDRKLGFISFEYASRKGASNKFKYGISMKSFSLKLGYYLN